jgi:hypothetical protein
LVETVGKAKVGAFWQTDGTAANTGITGELTVTSEVAVVAHVPAVGVNVYVLNPGVAVLIEAGLHVPLIPFVDVPGKEGAISF